MILNAGCGKTKFGDIRIDVDKDHNPDIICDIHFLPFRSDLFEEVYLIDVLEHLKNPFNSLLELKRVLNGILYIQIPNIFYYKRFLRLIKRGFDIPVNYRTSHLQIWDIVTLKQLMYFTGLEIIDHHFRFWEKEFFVVVCKWSNR